MKIACLVILLTAFLLSCEEQQYPVSPEASLEVSDGLFSNVIIYEGVVTEHYYRNSYISFNEVVFEDQDEIRIFVKRYDEIGDWITVDYSIYGETIRVFDYYQTLLGWKYKIIVEVSGDE